MGRHQSRHSFVSRERRLILYPEFIPGFELTVGKVNQTKAYDPIEEHIHEECFELVYSVRGKQIYTIGEQEYRVESGQCFMTLPNEQHSSGVHPEDKSILYYVIFSKELLRQVGFDQQECEQLQKILMSPTSRVFRGAKEMEPILEALATMPSKEGMLYKTEVRNHFTSLILQVVQHMGEQPLSEETIAFELVLAYIEVHIREEISIQELADLMHLSESRFKAYFRHVIGIPPGEYVLRQKIDKAKQLLTETSDTITEIAYAFSFSSSQYFATVFKRFTTFSPAQYRMNQTNR